MWKKNKKLLVKNCTVCGEKISIREMPSGQLKGFDIDTDNPHLHPRTLEEIREAAINHRSGLKDHVEETNHIVQKNISEKEYAIFRKSEKIAESKKKSHYGEGYAWDTPKPEFTEKEKEEFEEKKQQYDEEVANIRADLEVLKKKLENNSDTTPTNIENLNKEIKGLGKRCEELFDKEGFRKPSGGVYKDSSGGETHWDDWGDDGGKGLSIFEFPTDSNPDLKTISQKASVKNSEQFKVMYIGNRKWFWLKKPTASKISSFVQKLKSLFQTS